MKLLSVSYSPYQCPIDVRKDLAENIVIMGGTSILPGFFSRLQKELYDQLNKPKYMDTLKLKVFKFHQPPSKENYTAWLGGKYNNNNNKLNFFSFFFFCVNSVQTELMYF